MPIDDIVEEYLKIVVELRDLRTDYPEGDVLGAIELAYRRGEQNGIHKAFEQVRKKHPKAADELLEAFGMDAEGTIRIG